MTAITAPVTHAQMEGDLGRAFEYLDEAIRTELAETFDPAAVGLVELFGDVAATGTDTLRIRRIGGIGHAEAMTAMATETETILPSGLTTAYDTVTVARYGLAKNESFTRAIQQDDGVDLEYLGSQFAGSWVKTFRQQYAAAGAGFSASKGTSAAALDMDDWAGLVAGFEETEGFDMGLQRVVATLHPEQITDLRAALRNETGYQFPDETTRTQSLASNAGFKFNLWGIDVFASGDVTQSGGDHVGFAHAVGAIGYAVGSTSRIPIADGYMPVYVPERGIVIAMKADVAGALNAIYANAYFGLAAVDTTLAPAFKVLSVDN